MRGLRRARQDGNAVEESSSDSPGAKASGETQAQESVPRSVMENPKPGDEFAQPPSVQDDSNSGDQERKITKPGPVSSIVTGLLLVAACGAVAHEALVACLFGAVAVVAGVLGYTQSGRKSRLLYSFSAALFIAFLYFLVFPVGQAGPLQAEGNQSSPAASSQASPAQTTHSAASPSPTPHQFSSASSAVGKRPAPSHTQIPTNLKPEQATVSQGNSREFANSRVLIGIDNVYGDFASIAVSVGSLSCSYLNPSVGASFIVGTTSDGWYQIELLSAVANKSATIKVQRLGVTNTSEYGTGCPLV